MSESLAKNLPEPKIIFSGSGINNNGLRWSYAARRLRRAGYLPNGQPADYLLQGGLPSPHELRDGVD